MNIQASCKNIINLFRNPLYRLDFMSDKGFYHNMSDEEYLKRKFKLKMGYELNLDNPKTFNEKIQWLKIYDRKPEYTDMVDKYLAKEYVADIIGKEHIVPTYGVWDNFSEIDFNILPERFVIKCTHDSGGLIIVRNKDELDKEYAEKVISTCLKRNFYWGGREWSYKNVNPRVIVEKYMEDTKAPNGDLIDYKFYCFNGEPRFLYVSQGLEDHSTAKISFLTMDWEFAPFRRSDYSPFSELPEKPSQFDTMIDMAKKLSKNIPFLRVDLYQINEIVYFSELTFYTCSGYMPFEPECWDETIGDYIALPRKRITK